MLSPGDKGHRRLGREQPWACGAASELQVNWWGRGHSSVIVRTTSPPGHLRGQCELRGKLSSICTLQSVGPASTGWHGCTRQAFESFCL